MDTLKAIAFFTLAALMFGLAIGSSGCEYHTKTERRVAFFRKGENNNHVASSRDIGSFTQDRQRNKLDRALYKFFKTK